MTVGLVALGEQIWAGGPCNGPGMGWDKTWWRENLALGFPPPRGNRRMRSWISPCCAPSKWAQPRGGSWWHCWGHPKLPVSQHLCPIPSPFPPPPPPRRQRGNLAPKVGVGRERVVPPIPLRGHSISHRIFCSFLITNT